MHSGRLVVRSPQGRHRELKPPVNILPSMTLNHRVPGSSPGAPTTAIAGVSCIFTVDRMNRFVVRFVRFVRHPYTALSFLMADSASSSRPPR